MLSKKQKIAIKKLRSCIRAAQQYLDGPINSYQLDILFLIAMNEGITRKKVNEEMNKDAKSPLSMTTTNRYTADLTEWSYDKDRDSKIKKHGFNLINEIGNERDRRFKRLHLNDKGTELCEILANRVLMEQAN